MPAAVRAAHFVRSFERGLAVIRSFDAEHPARPGTRLRLPRLLHTAAGRAPASGATRRPYGESASLCVLDGDDAVHVACLSARRVLAVTITVGVRQPARATAAGRVLLAHLPAGELVTRRPTGALRRELDRIGHEGHAFVDPGLEEGLRAVAAPVRDRDGAVVASRA